MVPWVCFGAAETQIGFVCVNHQEPEPHESDSYVSWPFKKDPDGSFREMTVFGFGRKGHEKLVQHIADLTRLPARYSIAFVDRAEYSDCQIDQRAASWDATVTNDVGHRGIPTHFLQ